ncbi:lysozyme [Rubrivirga sp. S365]|uniref:Lysozyme n=1 Tax=Rubrivirga litoralis TaxID=3075598 RepID=A0ABU3BS96_9BACT|nr:MULTISPECIES: lysozyme [unclassified Rubrivirga]MDT0632138.1 lysozyme [Rubrivirga sp. F394]MDT7857029.1 lysozyme [Rubrivirga sp. S365]
MPTSPPCVSDAGLALIEQFEGFVPDWAPDPVGVPTIGYGWTGPLPAGFSPPLSRDEARALLRQTVEVYADAVRAAVTVPLTQGQFDALVSFTYNLGVGAFRRSTLLRRINAGDADAAEEFDRWTFAGGRRLRGLVRRRAAERALFEASAPPPLAHAGGAGRPQRAGWLRRVLRLGR